MARENSQTNKQHSSDENDAQTQDADFSSTEDKASRASAPLTEDERRLKTTIITIYALQAVGFLIGITWIVALVLSYLKRDEVKGTRYESHVRWQIRTFWFGLLWNVLGVLTTAVLIGGIILFVNYIWLIYRVAKGWMQAAEDAPILAYN